MEEEFIVEGDEAGARMNEKNVIPVKTIRELCDDRASFTVPSYQRGYRWGTTEKNNLLDDLQKYGDNPDTDDHDFLNTWIAKGKADTGPSEAMLFKARKAVVASGGDLHDVDDFKLESDIKKLREEVAQPDRTAASFADRVGPSQ